MLPVDSLAFDGDGDGDEAELEDDDESDDAGIFAVSPAEEPDRLSVR